MGLAADGVEADVVQIVGAGDDDEKGVLIAGNPGETFVKGGQDDFVGAGGTGVFREFRPVLQHGDAETEHAPDFCHRNADMPPAADDELRIVHGQILQIQHDSILTFRSRSSGNCRFRSSGTGRLRPAGPDLPL